MEDSEKVVYIPTGATFQSVLDTLDPYIKDKESFRLVAEKKGYASKVRPGRYTIEKGMNNNDLVNRLRVGNNPVKVYISNVFVKVFDIKKPFNSEGLSDCLEYLLSPDHALLFTF